MHLLHVLCIWRKETRSRKTITTLEQLWRKIAYRVSELSPPMIRKMYNTEGRFPMGSHWILSNQNLRTLRLTSNQSHHIIGAWSFSEDLSVNSLSLASWKSCGNFLKEEALSFSILSSSHYPSSLQPPSNNFFWYRCPVLTLSTQLLLLLKLFSVTVCVSEPITATIIKYE